MGEAASLKRKREGRSEWAGIGGHLTQNADPNVRQALDLVNQAMTSKFGRQSPLAERVPTFGDLADAGLIQLNLRDGSTYGSGSPEFAGVTPVPIPGPAIVERPHAPQNVIGVGAQTVVILRWDAPTYLGHAYSEVWKSATNNLASAALVGRAMGGVRVFADRIGQSGVTNYYWVRFVNQEEVAGPYNSSSGLSVTTGAASAGDVQDAYDLLVVDKGIIVEALIGDAEIGNAKIKDASIEDAKISTVSAGKILSGAIAVGRYIESSNYNAGTTGWRINSNGSAEFYSITARGDIEASNISANQTINAPYINGGTVNAAQIQGSTIIGTQIFGGEFIGNYLRNAAGTQYLSFDGVQPYILNTPNAKIFLNGSTKFNNLYWYGTVNVSVTFNGASGWAWQEISIDTLHNVSDDLADASNYVARLTLGNATSTHPGSPPGPGQYAFDFSYQASVSFDAAFFILGASPNFGSDPGSRNGLKRLRVLARIRPGAGAVDTTSITMTQIGYAIYRIS